MDYRGSHTRTFTGGVKSRAGRVGARDRAATQWTGTSTDSCLIGLPERSARNHNQQRRLGCGFGTFSDPPEMNLHINLRMLGEGRHAGRPYGRPGRPLWSYLGAGPFPRCLPTHSFKPPCLRHLPTRPTRNLIPLENESGQPTVWQAARRSVQQCLRAYTLTRETTNLVAARLETIIHQSLHRSRLR